MLHLPTVARASALLPLLLLLSQPPSQLHIVFQSAAAYRGQGANIFLLLVLLLSQIPSHIKTPAFSKPPAYSDQAAAC